MRVNGEPTLLLTFILKVIKVSKLEIIVIGLYTKSTEYHGWKCSLREYYLY